MTVKRKVGDRRIELGAIGSDIDLDEEEIRLADGTRLTEAVAKDLGKRMVEEYERRRGRPSLTGEAERTPNLTIRIPSQLRSSLQRIADREGRRLAAVSRDALVEYVKRHARVDKSATKTAAPARTVVKKAAAARAAAAEKAPVKAPDLLRKAQENCGGHEA